MLITLISYVYDDFFDNDQLNYDDFDYDEFYDHDFHYDEYHDHDIYYYNDYYINNFYK